MEQTDTEEEPWFRSVWADTEDETDAPAIELDLGRVALPGVARSAFARGGSVGLLRALSDAEAAALAAPDPVCEGVAARLAFREAAGWLARTGHWVHPLDLALRNLGLTGSYAAAALARQSRRALPTTLAEARGTTPQAVHDGHQPVPGAIARGQVGDLQRPAPTAAAAPRDENRAGQLAQREGEYGGAPLPGTESVGHPWMVARGEQKEDASRHAGRGCDIYREHNTPLPTPA